MKSHSLVTGLVLMFALTWPFYSALGLFVGYGLALAALIMTGLTLGRAGVRALLRRSLIWRVGIQWYVVILFGPAVSNVWSRSALWQWLGQRGCRACRRFKQECDSGDPTD